MRINKLLSNLGYCSRRDANRWIDEGLLTVNGLPCQQGQWLEKSDQVLFKGEPLVQQEKIYLLLNKPVGITCTAESKEATNIISFINYPQFIFPVGRLDKDSEGLMFLTNDGVLAHEVLVSENDHEKEYIVTVLEPITEAFIENMTRGVVIDGIMTKTCLVKHLSTHTFSITLCQGLNRQIRKMCHAFGYRVINLKRIRIMNLHLGEIEVGKWRYITAEELENLKRQVETEVSI
jgi:23S rRNA pseudouridine2604 synthase